MPDDFRLTDFPYCHTQEPTPWKIDPYWMAIDALQYGDTSLLDSLLARSRKKGAGPKI